MHSSRKGNLLLCNIARAQRVLFRTLIIMEMCMKFTNSLRSNRDFQNVFKSGRSYANKYLVMYVSKNQLDGNRLGISVSKKVGNSVVRHRVKRLIKESYRLQENIFNSGLDIVVIARNNAAGFTYQEAESALLHLWKLHSKKMDNKE